jgi:hypothetical protein
VHHQCAIEECAALKECLLNQFAAIHKLTMQFSGSASCSKQSFQNDDITLRFSNLAIKGSKACANIALTLNKLENGGKKLNMSNA